MNSQAQEMYWK